MSYKHILWDWNGTLIDDVLNALACVNDMLARKGRNPITLSQYYEYVETPIIGFYRHILPPEELDFSEISENYHKDYARHIGETSLAENAEEVLENLKNHGIKQYIVTATHIDEATELTEKFGVKEYFEEILGPSDNLAQSKIQRAKELFLNRNIKRSEALFVGDTLHDYEVANALGIDCVLVSYGHQGRKLLSRSGCFIVDSLKEVEKIIFDDRKVDFHTHSTCSDGSLSPSELVRHAEKNGLSAIALTDHDSVDGVKEALKEAAKTGIELIPGIEFSVTGDTELHIIGLFVDVENDTLLKTVEKLRIARKNRMKDIIKKLRSLGFDVTYEEALKESRENFVGRLHIAQVMINKGYTNSVKETFDKYIGIGKPCYSDSKDLTYEEAINAISASGGISFLAHLNQTGYDEGKLRTVLSRMKEAGLTGIEGYYTEYTDEQTAEYRTLAADLGLAFSGGSDFHGTAKPNIEIGTGTGALHIPYFALENLKTIKNNK